MQDLKSIKEFLYQVQKPLIILSDKETCSLRIETDPEFWRTKAIDVFSGHDFKAFVPAMPITHLGDSGFKERHQLKYAYVAGAMANGITSSEMVIAMAEQGMLAFFGAGGLGLSRIEDNIGLIKARLKDKPFGFNLIHSLNDPELEMATVKLYLKHGIRRISAAAFMRMTLPLVYYRVKGIHADPQGRIVVPNHVVAKVSRVEIARQFFAPPPEKLVTILLQEGLITQMEADLSRHIPMAQDLTAEADSGGHTDNRPALSLFPTMMALKHEFDDACSYEKPLCVGLGGGIATPESAAAAFQMGAAYILTGSINQSCREAGISEEVKLLLAQAQQADVAMAPAADMFEIGARVQVLKRGTMFPVRAEKLYQIYKTYDRFEDVPAKLQAEIEEKFLKATFEHKWEETRTFFEGRQQFKEIEKAASDPRHKMALVFRAYLGLSSRWAITGDPDRKMDYQIWCGPSIGAFNQWVKGSFLESPDNRKVVPVALNILTGAAISIRMASLRNQGIELPEGPIVFKPMPLEILNSYIL